jgi:hypothetical protein
MTHLRTHIVSSLAMAVCLAASPCAMAGPGGITLVGAPDFAASVPATRTPAPKNPTPIVDIDAAGREPFQANVQLSLSAGSVSVPIPAGKRLIVEHIAAVAFANSANGAIQPLVVAYVTQAGSAAINFEYVMNPYQLLSYQFSLAQQVTLYADTLTIGLGYAGSTPANLDEGVSISGHLITVAAPPAAR